MLIHIVLEYNKKIQRKTSLRSETIDAFVLGLLRSDFVKEMGKTKPRTVSELMDVTNKFVDGKDAYHNKRTRSPKDDRSNRYSNQRCRSRTVLT
jgi:hypothetical protein